MRPLKSKLLLKHIFVPIHLQAKSRHGESRTKGISSELHLKMFNWEIFKLIKTCINLN